MSKHTLKKEDLAQFTGTEQWYQHAIVRSVKYTDGAKYVAETGGAYWLLDQIAIAQRFELRLKTEAFQVWKLTVMNGRAVLRCEDGNDNVLLTEKIPFTGFPLDEITLWYASGVIMLPSEY